MSITYEQIAAANATIKTTPIKGKDYADVAQRIRAFRMVYPDGWIETEMLSNENGICVFRAFCGCYDDDVMRHTLGTGHAFEREDSSYINKTSYIENCETSAVGRALGMAGFGIDVSVCSADELQSALEAQGGSKKPPRETQKEQSAKKDVPKEKTPEIGADDLDEAEQAAVDTVIGILNGVVDAETATRAVPALQAVKHTEKSRRVARRAMNCHMEALGLVYDADAKAYKQKQEAPVC